LVGHVISTLNDQFSTQPVEVAETRRTEARPKILIVDDNVYDARLVRRILESDARYEVNEARSGQGALQLIRDWRPALVILDIMLPDMSGFDVLDQLRASGDLDHPKVAMLSTKELTATERARLGDAMFWHKATLDQHTLVPGVEQQLIPTV
jgi:CheY-like chemotaxis protein